MQQLPDIGWINACDKQPKSVTMPFRLTVRNCHLSQGKQLHRMNVRVLFLAIHLPLDCSIIQVFALRISGVVGATEYCLQISSRTCTSIRFPNVFASCGKRTFDSQKSTTFISKRSNGSTKSSRWLGSSEFNQFQCP